MSLFKRFPSLSHVFVHAGGALRRFPYVLAAAATGTAAAIYLIHQDSTTTTPAALKLLLVSALGLPLFTALTTYAERKGWRDSTRLAFPLLGAALLALYYFTLPVDIERPLSHVVRFFLLGLGLHFLVAFLPYLRSGEVDGFWQYNKSLFIRFLTAALYSGVLFAGLAIALAAVDHLFGVDIDEKIYGELWCIIAGLFNTWVFLAGIPEDLEAQNRADDYPAGLKVFTQYILLPLVVLYFVILIAYEAKILATWNWPKGWVSHLVLWYSVVGILSLLLLYPLQKRTENRWIVAFGRWFFRGLIPLVLMLFLAIYQRIDEYGITVNRYLVLSMAVGLAVVVLYFVFSRRRDIRAIPIVLSALAFLTAYGPQSAFSVSAWSQRQRLEAYMVKHGILQAGSVRKTTAEIPWEDRREMSSIVSYLCEWHGAGAYAGWFPDSLMAVWDTTKGSAWQEQVTEAMGFKYYPRWRGSTDGEYFNFSTDKSKPRALTIADFDYLLEINSNLAADSLAAFALDGDSCFVRFNRDSATIWICMGPDGRTGADSVVLELQAGIQGLVEEGVPREIEPERLTFDREGRQYTVRVMIQNVNGNVADGRVKLDWVRVRLMIRRL